MIRIFSISFVTVCVVMGMSTWVQAAERRALLIGINDYASPQLPDLRGAVNDIDMLSRILETRFGFEQENILLLKDSTATRAGVLKALDQFVTATGKDDVVYIHYSGHGSRLKDLSGDETDGLDETILPHDARMPGVRDILDDELEQRFARLEAKHALIVFDSCHSGTVTRSASLVQPRFVAPDIRLELYEDAVRTREAVPVGELNHILMAGAPAEQEALDGPLDEGFYGLFSYSLARSLDANGPEATPLMVHDGVKQELRRISEQLYTRTPEPQLEAPAERMSQPILPLVEERADVPYTSSAARRAWVPADLIGRGKIVLRGGASLNATPGSNWGIYGPDETVFAYGDAVAQGTVQRLKGNDAVLQVVSQRAPIARGARAIKIAPPDVSANIPVQISGVDADRAAAIVAALAAEVNGVRAVPAGQFARFIIEQRDGQWVVMGAGGLRAITQFADGSDAEVSAQLAAVLSRASNAMALLALDNPAAAMRVSASIQQSADYQMQGGYRGLVKVSGGTEPVFRMRRSNEPRNEKNSLMVRVQADRDAYITIASVDTEGKINLLFPNDYQKRDFLPAGFVPANQSVAIPDSLATGNRAGFYWDYGPPAGLDTVRVFATTELETAKTIRRFIAESTQDSTGLQQLQGELASYATRGIRVVADDSGADTNGSPGPASGEWAATSLQIRVQE